jgi:hypothetical protein
MVHRAPNQPPPQMWGLVRAGCWEFSRCAGGRDRSSCDGYVGLGMRRLLMAGERVRPGERSVCTGGDQLSGGVLEYVVGGTFRLFRLTGRVGFALACWVGGVEPPGGSVPVIGMGSCGSPVWIRIRTGTRKGRK